MTGGYTIIPLRSATGEKINVTSTAVNLKPGTYKKFLRAIRLQKPIIINDLKLSNFEARPGIFVSISGTYAVDDTLIMYIYFTGSQGTIANVALRVTSTDTIYASNIV